MRAIILEATLTGATGESSPVPGAIGFIRRKADAGVAALQDGK